MYRTDNKDIWRVFGQHHYLSADMNKAATVYTLYWGDILVGLNAVLPNPSGWIKYSRRESRLVILPDYQGLGIGTKFSEFIGDYYLRQGHKYFVRSTHLRLNMHREKSPLWSGTSHNGRISDASGGNLKIGDKDAKLKRVAYAYEYMGYDYVNKPHLEIRIDDNVNIDYNILESDLKYLKEKYWLCIVTGEINTSSKIEDICLRLGIRTQLLYATTKGVSNIGKKYQGKKIITTWDKEFSDKIRRAK